jgi:hypothetical protein
MDTLLTTRLRQIADLLENMNRGPTQNAEVCRNAAKEIEAQDARIVELTRKLEFAVKQRDSMTDRMIAAGLGS